MLNGIVIICNPDFLVQEVIFNSINELCIPREKTHLKDLIDAEETIKVESFIQHVRQYNVAFDIELTVKCKDKFKPLKFSGSRFNSNYFLFGLETNNDVPFLYDELIRINNEQSNYIRQIIKEQFMVKPDEKSDIEALEELTKLNNGLANLQRELSKKNIELENLNNIKNRFLGMAAHDLRNPLGYIYNYVELVEGESERLSDNQKSHLTQIKNISTSMVRMVNDLLDYSVIESGHINLKLEKVNLTEIIKTSVELHKNFADKKSIQIEFFSSHPIITGIIDIDKIEQVIANLITNAIKYSEPGTKIEILISDNINSLEIKVKDQGQGMSEEESKKLFNPFQTTSARATGGEKSTGLGLFISKRIIEAHNGKIWVKSKKNIGSEFYVELPKNKKPG